jgi:hypothetical protein
MPISPFVVLENPVRQKCGGPSGRAPNEVTHSWQPLKAATYSLFCVIAIPCLAGGPVEQASYKVLPAIVRENLAIFPVVAPRSRDTSQFLTLDEGIRSGQVTISENGNQTP